MSDKMKNLIVRSITGVLFVAIVVVCFLEALSMLVIFALVTGMTVWEFTGLANEIKDVQVNRLISTVAGVYFHFAVAGFCTGLTPSAVFIPYLVTLIYLFISGLYTNNKNVVNDWAYTMLGQMYIVLPFSMINVLAFMSGNDGQAHYNYLIPLSVFVFLWTNDTGAYCSGSLFGKHKLFPRISPNKSWEGSIGGAVLVLVVAGFIGYMDSTQWHSGASYTIPQWLGLGMVVTLFGTWGDLVESLFKRTLGIKDSGTILPGHGGMLDRFDSALMAIPASVVYLYTLTLF